MRPLLLLAFSTALAASAATITRGPALQRTTETSVTLHFTTDVPGLARVRYGLTPTTLTLSVADATAVRDHALTLTSLSPATRYSYALDLDGMQISGIDLNGRPVPASEYTFRTANVTGSPEPFRLYAWGDSGTGAAGQFAVATAMSTQLNGGALALILGDIIYPDGAAQDYDPKFFVPYQSMLRRMNVWPVIGNHDVASDPNGGPWRAAFDTPANNPTHDEVYYSFDYGNAHFVVLDTHVNDFSANSAQLTWARADLAASSAVWKVAAFHIPPWTGGTHSDNAAVIAGIVPSLEAAGVDIVLAGHSHVYERTFLIKNGAVVQNDFSTYSKATNAEGTLYIVSGTAGQSGALSLVGHPLMAVQRGNTLGATVIDFSARVAHGSFLLDTGASVDLFTLSKGPDVQAPRLVAARSLSPTLVELAFDEPVTAGAATAGAERPANYTLSSGRQVLSALLLSDQRTVQLTTAAHTNGRYVVSAAHVTDRATPPNAVAAQTQASFEVTSAPLVDAGPDTDAGPTDAGRLDAGAPGDAGGVDAGGQPDDAGSPHGDAGSALDDGGSPLGDASTPDASVQVGTPDWQVLLGSTTPVRFLNAGATVPADWQAYRFDDSAWSLGHMPLGSGGAGLATDSHLAAPDTRLLARLEFDVSVSRATIKSAFLDLQATQAWVAFLNGAELARSQNAGPAGIALGLPAGSTTARVPISAQQLVDGDNVLALDVQTAPGVSVVRLEASVQAQLFDAGTPVDAGGIAGPDAGPTATAIDAGPVVGPAAGPESPRCGCSAPESPASLAMIALLAMMNRRRR